MRVGLAWELPAGAAAPVWEAVLHEMATADRLGYDSVWFDESRHHPGSCPAPSIVLTRAARRASNVQLRAGRRTVTRTHPVRLAEEIAVLDLFSRGRAGVSFASATSQGIEPGHLHEVVRFVQSAWTADEFRFRGRRLRFPAHTADTAAEGVSFPTGPVRYVPQWERGPATPDFLAVTPKPFAVRPPVSVDIADPETLEWCAGAGVSPFVGADVAGDEAAGRLRRYREAAGRAGRDRFETEPVLERMIELDGDGRRDGPTVEGSSRAVLDQLRAVASGGMVSHIVWRRRPDQIGNVDELERFAAEVQVLLQA